MNSINQAFEVYKAQAQEDLDKLCEAHRPCTLWTIKVEDYGMSFTISHIAFRDIAEAAASGIRQAYPKARVSVYNAQPASAASTSTEVHAASTAESPKTLKLSGNMLTIDIEKPEDVE